MFIDKFLQIQDVSIPAYTVPGLSYSIHKINTAAHDKVSIENYPFLAGVNQDRLNNGIENLTGFDYSFFFHLTKSFIPDPNTFAMLISVNAKYSFHRSPSQALKN